MTLNLRKEKLADDLLGEQNKANAILDNTIALANDNYLKATEKTNINLKIALANAAIIVEDNLNSKWNQDQFTFNYQMPCSNLSLSILSYFFSLSFPSPSFWVRHNPFSCSFS
jgi:hypothetical protein